MKMSRIIPSLEFFLFGAGVGLVVVGLVWSVVFIQLYNQMFLPGITISGQDLKGMSKDEAHQLLSNSTNFNESELVVMIDEQKFATPTASLSPTSNLDQVIHQAYERGRSGFVLTRIWQALQLSIKPINYQLQYDLDHDLLSSWMIDIAAQTNTEGAKPKVTLQGVGVVVNPGQDGWQLDQERLMAIVLEELKPGQIEVKTELEQTIHSLDQEQIEPAQGRASHLGNQTVEITSPDYETKVTGQKLVDLLTFPDGYDSEELDLLIEKWSVRVNRTPQDAEFEYDLDKKIATKFVPHRTGYVLDLDQTLKKLEIVLQDLEKIEVETTLTLELPIIETPPIVTLDKTNDIGVNTRLGIGSSLYAHSIPNRIHNVTHTANIITNTLVAPGEEFSFVKELGDVSSTTGFRSAYVISGGQTILAEGGGVCQVSTTLFRTLLDSGVNITLRRNHSYRVGYYEQDQPPGFDATVYNGNVDLRFINDTPGYIVLHSQTNPDDLSMFVEAYGTDDGRTTEISEYKQWGFSSAPAPIYIPDPSLPTGVTRQTDWSATGLKTSFKHTIRDKDGNIMREKVYASNYQPWSAKFRIGI